MWNKDETKSIKFIDNTKKFKLTEEDDLELETPENTEDDFDFDVADSSSGFDILYEDDSFKLCRPTCEWGMMNLSRGTTWLSGRYMWSRNTKAYDEIDDDSWALKHLETQYVIFDKKNEKKKYRITKGSGDINSASGARYSAATWLANNGTLGLNKWFLNNNFQFITTNLKKKMGAELLGKTSTYVLKKGEDVGHQARAKSTQITDIKISNDITSLKDLSGFSNVKKLIIPEGVKRISRNACSYMNSLEEVSLPSTLTFIGDYAFYEDKNIKKIFIPSSVKTIKGQMLGRHVDIWRAIIERGDNYWELSDNEKLSYYAELVTPIKDEVIIYCEASSKPEGWDDDWNNITYKFSSLPESDLLKYNVVWGASRADAGITEDLSEDINDDTFDLDVQDFDLHGLKLSEEHIEKIDDIRMTYWRNGYGEEIDDLNALFHSYPHNNDNGQWYLFNVEDDDDFFHDYNTKYPYQLVYQSFENRGPAFFHDRLYKGVGVGRISKSLLNKLGISDEDVPSTHQASLQEDVDDEGTEDDFDVVDSSQFQKIKKLYEDDTWIVQTPENYYGLVKLSENTNWGYDEELDRKASEDDNFDPYSSTFKLKEWNNYKLYIFTNKKTKKVYGYCTNEWHPTSAQYSRYLYDDESNELDSTYRKTRWVSNGAEVLVGFLEHNGTPGLCNWASKKWEGGLKDLKQYVDAKQVAEQNNYKLTYGSTLYKDVTNSDSWDADFKKYKEIKKLIKEIEIPNGVKSIEPSSLSNFSNITSIIIPDSVTSIGGHAFYNCTSLTSVTIPNSVTDIGDSAFRDCTSLTSITIPNSVTSIGRWVFADCSSLTSITIPYSVTLIDNYAFYFCSSLTSIVIPDSTTSIGPCAFQNCHSLTSITISNSVTSIGNYTFNGCTSLKSITIPNSVTTIGMYAFSSCDSLTSIKLPKNLTSIGGHAFEYCKSLTSIIIPNSVISIGNEVFSHCTSLTIYCEAESKPDGWDDYWNAYNRPVVWGYHGETTEESFNKIQLNNTLQEDLSDEDVEELLDVRDTTYWQAGREEAINKLKSEAQKYGAKIENVVGMYPLRQDAHWDNGYDIIVNDKWAIRVFTSGDFDISSDDGKTCIYDEEGLNEYGIFTDDEFDFKWCEDEHSESEPVMGYEDSRYLGFCVINRITGADYYSYEYGYEDFYSINELPTIEEFITEQLPYILGEIGETLEDENDHEEQNDNHIESSEDNINEDIDEESNKDTDGFDFEIYNSLGNNETQLDHETFNTILDSYVKWWGEVIYQSSDKSIPEREKRVLTILMNGHTPIYKPEGNQWYSVATVGYYDTNNEFNNLIDIPVEVYNDLVSRGIIYGEERPEIGLPPEVEENILDEIEIENE